MLSFHDHNIFICRANAFCSGIVCKEVRITKCSLNVGRNSYNSDFSLIYAGLELSKSASTHEHIFWKWTVRDEVGFLSQASRVGERIEE